MLIPYFPIFIPDSGLFIYYQQIITVAGNCYWKWYIELETQIISATVHKFLFKPEPATVCAPTWCLFQCNCPRLFNRAPILKVIFTNLGSRCWSSVGSWCPAVVGVFFPQWLKLTRLRTSRRLIRRLRLSWIALWPCSLLLHPPPCLQNNDVYSLYSMNSMVSQS